MGNEEVVPEIGSKAEFHRAIAAIDETRLRGHSDKKCLRCGKNFELEERGSSYIIRCQTEGCFSLTGRGI